MINIPDLFIRVENDGQKKITIDLNRFLYDGSAAVSLSKHGKLIKSGLFYEIKPDRLDLLLLIKEIMEETIVYGGSVKSIESLYAIIKQFFKFIDEKKYICSLDLIEEIYLDYCEYLFIISNKNNPDISKSSAYSYGSALSTLLGKILELPTPTSLIRRTRLKPVNKRKGAVGKREEKQNLESTFKLGNFLVCLIEEITIEAVLGPLPFSIPAHEGLVENNEVEITAGLPPLLEEEDGHRYPSAYYYHSKAIRQPVSNIDGTFRWRIVNLRIQAEFLVFIAQTGMNFSQASTLRCRHFKYKDIGDSWEVRSFKSRRAGEVFFKIYKTYKQYLQRYITFINHFFPDSDLLFPYFDSTGIPSQTSIRVSKTLKNLLLKHNIPWVSPRQLRCTRINWLLRRSGDYDLTAEMAQHTKEILKDKYERPSQQRAMVEITQFWNKHDPILIGDLKASVIGSSRCNGQPVAINGMPSSVTTPNCLNPSGCLWCKSHRDSDTCEYVWALVSFRHLKSIEASLVVTRDHLPSDKVIDRLSDKILWFKNASKTRAKWVEEAEQRIEENYYHPDWSDLIEALE